MVHLTFEIDDAEDGIKKGPKESKHNFEREVNYGIFKNVKAKQNRSGYLANNVDT